jgi:hypothetical protein
MARERRLMAGALNIALPAPHSPGRYVALIQSIFRMKEPVRVRGDEHLMLSSIDVTKQYEGYITGSLARFTVIDMEMPWFNIENLGPANVEMQESIFIPQELRPNYRAFLFYYDLNKHVFVFEHASPGESLSASLVFKFFTEITLRKSIFEEFQNVAVSLIQSEEGLQEILDLKKFDA